jgi:hypothetical protein
MVYFWSYKTACTGEKYTFKIMESERPSDFMQLMIPHSQLLINNLLLVVWRTLLSPGLVIVLKKLYPRDTIRFLVINIYIAAIQKCEWEISSTNECKVLKFCMVAGP